WRGCALALQQDRAATRNADHRGAGPGPVAGAPDTLRILFQLVEGEVTADLAVRAHLQIQPGEQGDIGHDRATAAQQAGTRPVVAHVPGAYLPGLAGDVDDAPGRHGDAARTAACGDV